MKLTTKGRYAVAALLDMAIHNAQKPITVKQLSQRQGLSQSYLERLTGHLRLGGLLTSVKGPGGGYLLSRALNEISIADIIQAVDEPVDMTKCQGKGNCQGGNTCLTHHLWSEVNREILNILKKITLDHLVKNSAILDIAFRQQRNLHIATSTVLID